MNLPNRLTILRIVCTVFMAAFILLDAGVFAWLGFVLFVAASITDYFDGRIARANGLVTNFGKFMDPLADKILNYSVMILLVPEGLVPALAVVLILFREFMVAGIRQTAAERGRVIAANIWGKIKTLVQDISLGAILFFRACHAAFLTDLSHVLLWICVALTVISGAIYLRQNIDIIRE